VYNWGIVRRVLGTLLFVFFNATGVEAQVSECESFDDDRNGSVETADVGPLIEEYVAVSECMSTDFSAELLCEPYDANGDSSVSLYDFLALMTMRERYTQCTGSLVAEQPECAQSDVNSDGRVDFQDSIEIEHFIDRFRPCWGADLSALRCAWVDFDGDATVSSLDQDIWVEHLNAFQSCLGPPVASIEELWISHDRLMSLPMSGPAWGRIFAEAGTPYQTPDLSDQNDRVDTRTLAKALVGVRTSREDLIDEARRALRAVTYDASERGANSLAVARGLVAYIFAADILDLAVRDPALDSDFREKLRFLRDAGRNCALPGRRSRSLRGRSGPSDLARRRGYGRSIPFRRALVAGRRGPSGRNQPAQCQSRWNRYRRCTAGRDAPWGLTRQSTRADRISLGSIAGRNRYD